MEVVDEFPGRGIKKSDIFATICDGKIYKLTKGEDFSCNVETLRVKLSGYCITHNLNYRTRKFGDFLYVQILGNNDTSK
jgi:uncharacterized protein YcgI (DUF1989 family)